MSVLSAVACVNIPKGRNEASSGIPQVGRMPNSFCQTGISISFVFIVLCTSAVTCVVLLVFVFHPLWSVWLRGWLSVSSSCQFCTYCIYTRTRFFMKRGKPLFQAPKSTYSITKNNFTSNTKVHFLTLNFVQKA